MNKSTPGPCKEVVMGPTSHGGTYLVSYYFDSKYAPVPKNKATRIIIHEYDEKNRSVYSDYISCGPNDEEEFAAMEAYELSEKPQQKPEQASPAKKQENTDGRPGRPEGQKPFRAQDGQRPPRMKYDRGQPGQPRPPKPFHDEHRQKDRPEDGKGRPHSRQADQNVQNENERKRREARSAPRPRPEDEKPKQDAAQHPRRAENSPKPDGEKHSGDYHRRPRRRPQRKPGDRPE